MQHTVLPRQHLTPTSTPPRCVACRLESLFPLFSALLHQPGFKRTPDRLLVLYQRRAFLLGWVRAVLAVALGMRPGQDLPPLVLQQESPDPWKQLLVPLEGVQPGEWVCFEKVLWIKVRAGGRPGCWWA